MGRNTNSGYGNSYALGSALPFWLKDPFFREVYEQRPHQVTP